MRRGVPLIITYYCDGKVTITFPDEKVPPELLKEVSKAINELMEVIESGSFKEVLDSVCRE